MRRSGGRHRHWSLMELKRRPEVHPRTLRRLNGKLTLTPGRIDERADIAGAVLIDLDASFGSQSLVKALIKSRHGGHWFFTTGRRGGS
jgi:hypothetical protein